MSKKPKAKAVEQAEPYDLVNIYDAKWVAGRIREAAPLAAHFVAHGVGGDDVDIVGTALNFSGGKTSLDGLDVDRDFERALVWVANAFAIGVAYGQRLQPGAFEVNR